MDRYIEQLLEDLSKAATNPPEKPYIEPPPHVEDDEVISELALMPFKSIAEWTGIQQMQFPLFHKLNRAQIVQLNEAIFKIFKSLHLALIDVPPDLPPELLYDIFTEHWIDEIQYLPSSGMDWELCSGNPITCPYGDFCDCGEEREEHDHNDLPEHFNEVISQIAPLVDLGFTCFLEPNTQEFETVLEQGSDVNDKNSSQVRKGEGGKYLKHYKWDICCRIEPVNPAEILTFMKFFILGVEDALLMNKLNDALSHDKPLKILNAIINNSDQQQEWLTYKLGCIETHVRKIIWEELNNFPEDLQEEINGFYNDDGEKIDPGSVPVPSLCVICKKHQADDWEENLLCLMNRYDQRNDNEFICSAFEKI